MSRKIALIFGASSGIAQAICRELLKSDHAFILLARDPHKLQVSADDLVARGAQVLRTYRVDFRELGELRRILGEAAELGPIDFALVAHGIMHGNDECVSDDARFAAMVDTNFTAAAFCAYRSVPLFDARNGGDLVVISSVAGDRGRAKNFFYGATKAGLDQFVQGLRLANAASTVNIMNLKPGPVDTAMSAALAKGALWTTPEQVARVMCNALGKRRHVVYAPGYWRLIMFVVRNLPEFVLARLPI